MGRVFILALQISICISFISCKEKEQEREFGESEKNEIREQIRQMLTDYFGAIKEEGLRAEFDYLDNSKDFFWVPPGFNSALSYDSVRQILEKNAESMKSINFQWNTLTVYPLSDKIANYTGIVEGTIESNEGMINKVRMIESGTVIRREGNWKILSGQSRNLPE